MRHDATELLGAEPHQDHYSKGSMPTEIVVIVAVTASVTADWNAC